MKQFTLDQAWLFFLSDEWKKWDLQTVLHFQLQQKHLCVGVSKLEKACKKYKITFLSGNQTMFPAKKKQKARFYRKTGLADCKLSEFPIPKKLLLFILKKDAVTVSQKLNNLNIKRYEKKKSRRDSYRRLAFKRRSTRL